jgi:CRP/FNR family transcriptional regulator
MILTPVDERARLIAQVPLFSSLSAREIDALAGRVIERHFRPGDLLFSEGDPCGGLHVLVAGTVKIIKTSTSGREITLHIESAPSSIAEVPLFDGGPYPATVVAVDAVHCCILCCRDFQALCRDHPEMPPKILAAVGRRLRALVSLIESLTFGNVRQRFARLLLELAEDAGDDTFALPITLQEIALRLGTAREVISRNMSRFQAEGLVSLRKREVVVLNRHGLLREAETEL